MPSGDVIVGVSPKSNTYEHNRSFLSNYYIIYITHVWLEIKYGNDMAMMIIMKYDTNLPRVAGVASRNDGNVNTNTLRLT
jgi:hypothetical protein